ncbi:hypothetical protein [Hyphomonas sp.]|uniref:hypothetical protein n=1 Tax=Hyphomonas sp. TaxID=87 RepID=UPI0025BD9673|nr:hypothetical protein [Hyphomonas sp.]
MWAPKGALFERHLTTAIWITKVDINQWGNAIMANTKSLTHVIGGIVVFGAVSVSTAFAPTSSKSGLEHAQLELEHAQLEQRSYSLPNAQDGLTLAQSPDDFGACYVWLRVTPWKESCSEVTREYCDLQNTITLGRRFEQGGTCPEGM